VKEGSNFNLFVNGVLEDTKADPNNLVASTNDLLIGRENVFTTRDWNGHIDEGRFSNIARYTANFTPSTSPFVNDANTLLLLHMDGTDASTYFEDDNGVPGALTSVRTANSITAVADAQVDTAQSKFGGASALFDGTGDYLQINSSSTGPQIIPSTGVFTFEMWVRFTDLSAQRTVISQFGFLGDANPAGRLILRSDSATTARLFIDGIINTTTTIATNTWYHFALSRDSSNVFRWYKDGVQVGTATSSNSIAGGYTAIGAIGNTGGTTMHGHIDEVRISNIARYTGTFTPSSQAFVNDSNTLLLIHADGADASTTFTDDTLSITGRTKCGVAATGNAQVDTAQSKFGGASADFDASGDYLTFQPGFKFQPGESFTMECWFRIDGAMTVEWHGLISLGTTRSSSADQLELIIRKNAANTGNVPKLGIATNFTLIIGYITEITVDVWHHAAVSRDGNTYRLFLDGALEGTNSARTDDPGQLTGGRIGAFADGSLVMDGWIDEVRISDVARYTSNFTPQTTPFQNDSNTLLLLHMDGTDGSTVFTDDNGVPPDYEY
jgi:hypothetical protein